MGLVPMIMRLLLVHVPILLSLFFLQPLRRWLPQMIRDFGCSYPLLIYYAGGSIASESVLMAMSMMAVHGLS